MTFSWRFSFFLSLCHLHWPSNDEVKMAGYWPRSFLCVCFRGGSRRRVQGVCIPPTPPSLRWSFLLRIYVLAFKIFLAHCQWRHSLEVHPLLRKILDPPLCYGMRQTQGPMKQSWKKNIANIQTSWTRKISNKGFIVWKRKSFSCGTQWVIQSRQDSPSCLFW